MSDLLHFMYSLNPDFLKTRFKTIVCLFFLSSGMFAQTPGDSLFNTLQIHTIQINFTQPDYWALLVNNKSFDDANDSSTYIPAQVIIDGNTLDSAGIQFKGNSSYYNYPGNKKPFTISFDQYDTLKKYDGLKSINLNNLYQDPSFMREKLFLDFLNEKGLYAPSANYAKLYLNGAYWGLYYISERVNKTFCKSNFGNKDGNLFKGDGNSAACANLEYHGVMSPYYNCYTLKTNTTANDWTDLINLTYQINMTPDSGFKDSVDAVLNANSFIGAWAACNMFIDFDSYTFRFVHNYYIYHNTTTNKFEWITWDVSTAFGMDVPGSVSSIEGKSIFYIESPASYRPLANRMLNDSAYKMQYLSFICNFIQDFQPAVFSPKIDSIYNLIKNDVYTDSLKMFTNSDFDNNINSDVMVNSTTYPGLKSFIQNRSSNIQNELNSMGINCSSFVSMSEIEKQEDGIYIFPNPFSSEVIVQFTLSNPENMSIVITDILGKEIYHSGNFMKEVGLQRVIIKSEIFALPGIYFLKMKIGNNFISDKILRI